MLRAVQDELGVRLARGRIHRQVARREVTPVVEQERSEAGAPDRLEVLLRDDRVGVDVGAVQRRHGGGHALERLHAKVLTSTKWPAMPAAAAMAGETRWVRPPCPCLPSKLRLLVEAQRSPGSSRSAFMARHIEQPGSRHSKPAARNTASRPSASAWRFTSPDPGTTMASLTLAALRRPRTTWAAARRSSMRALVHEPMNTLSIPICSIFVPADRPM